MEKLDIKKTQKHLYKAPTNDFVHVEVPDLQFVMINGMGTPEGEDYAKAVQWLYSTVFPMKFIAKKELERDFVAPPLQGLWWADDLKDFIRGRKENWRWQMMLPVPDWVDDDLFGKGLEKSVAKNGEKPDSLRLERFEEGQCVQILHIGPYHEEAPTIKRLHEEYLPAQGLCENGHHHEIYMNDPRKTAPEKLKTILRQPVKPLG